MGTLPFTLHVETTKLALVLIKNGPKAVLNKDKEMPAVADLLNTLINSDEEESAHMFTEMMQGPAISEFVNLKAKNGMTPLQVASEVNSLDKVLVLIKNGAKSVLNKDSDKPAVADLLITLINSDKEHDDVILGEMLKVPAISEFVNLKDKNGMTPLQAACNNNDELTVSILSAAGATISPKDKKSKKFLEKYSFTHPVGIQHLIEHPTVAGLLEDWMSAEKEKKKEAEERVKEHFNADVNVIFVPTFGLEENEKEKLRRNTKEWNRSHTMKGKVEV